MQGYSYSIFSLVAIAVHLMINFDLIAGRKADTTHGARYRDFLLGVLAYYVADGAWGVLAGLGWTRLLYVCTICFFLSNVLFALMWCRFIVSYLDFGNWTSLALSWAGRALLAINAALLAANVRNGCVFYFDAQGTYLCGPMRDPLFYLLIAFNALTSCAVLLKALRCRDAARGRIFMVFVLCLTLTLALALQVVWPLTPFTALGCLVGNCFFHVSVIREEQMERHMAELEDALERARSAEKARSLFFSIVSHDIRTPLNAILGYSELLQRGIDNPSERDEALKSIRASGTTLLQLVNDVLDQAKLDAGKMTLQPEPVRLADLTDEVFAAFRLAADGKGLALVNRASRVADVMLDGHRFRQILFNLVGNAVKFTDRGSVTVSAHLADGVLTVSVADTGCGIAPDKVARITEPFFQIKDPSRSSYNDLGTGLGLSICKNLAETMGGSLSVESAPGKGSTFIIRIPGVAAAGLPAAPVPSAAPSSAPAPSAARPRRVLVVDDSPVNRHVLAAFLKRAGVTAVDFAADGAEALATLNDAAANGQPHDLVFTDYWMPNMNGFEFVQRLRADPRFATLRVFAVTADTESRTDPRAGLFTGILLKPLTYPSLLNVLTV
ncbi:MAG: response regulator [Kiritimatiellae bacterium]|nr:response regulator [Kiritimatiellia bacterium]